MNRRDDWRQQFKDVIDTASHCEFCIGRHDCVIFVAYAIDRMCDTNFVVQLRNTYGTLDELSAINIMESSGGLKSLATTWLGDPVPVSEGRPGDVVLIRMENLVSMGLIENHNVVCASQHGVSAVPLHFAECAWRVG